MRSWHFSEALPPSIVNARASRRADAAALQVRLDIEVMDEFLGLVQGREAGNPDAGQFGHEDRLAARVRVEFGKIDPPRRIRMAGMPGPVENPDAGRRVGSRVGTDHDALHGLSVAASRWVTLIRRDGGPVVS